MESLPNLVKLKTSNLAFSTCKLYNIKDCLNWSKGTACLPVDYCFCYFIVQKSNKEYCSSSSRYCQMGIKQQSSTQIQE